MEKFLEGFTKYMLGVYDRICLIAATFMNYTNELEEF